MYLEVITPDQVLFKGEVSSITLPGKDGSFQILKDHAPIISALRKGTVTLRLADGTQTLDHLSSEVILDTSDDKVATVEILGGVLECQNNLITILAS